MDTDEHGFRVDLHNPENTKLLLKDETHQISGCAFDVLNEIGHGLHEKIYENALAVEFNLRGIPYEQQKHFPVPYKGVLLGEFVPDLIAFDSVIMDAKTIVRITEHERGRMTNYLRISKLRVGLTLNFKHARLEWDRVVL
jgi:GxxExxY protein